jgi:carbon-monoxide dehydrogenase medium subunit
VKPAAFAYHAPTRLEEALALLEAHGDDARPLAGGQSLVPMMNMRIARPEHVIDINGLSELDFIRETGDAVLIGALVRHRAIERSKLLRGLCPMLPAVARSIGHYAIRERGTLGGSLALADPAAQWPLIAALLDAQIHVAAAGARRIVPARDFFQGVFTTALGLGELITAVGVPKAAAREGWGYRAFSRRHGDFAIVAVAATVALDAGGAVEWLRLALGGFAGTPLALDELAAGQHGRIPEESWMQEVAREAAQRGEPGSDLQATAVFRRELAEVLTVEALADAVRTAHMQVAP